MTSDGDPRTAKLIATSGPTWHEPEQLQRLNALPDLVFRFDEEARFLDFKAPAHLMPVMPAERFVGHRVTEVFPGEFGEAVAECVRHVLASGEPLTREYRLPIPGHEAEYQSRYVPWDERNVLAFIRDITDLKQAERALQAQVHHLRELDQLKSNMIASVGHELRTPLTAIMGYAELLEDQAREYLPPEQLNYIGHMHQGILRIERLLDDMLDHARLDAGTFRLRPEEVDVVAAIREVLESFLPGARRADVDLRSNLPAGPLPVVMDAGRIGQVLSNLIANAIKFSQAGGTVTVRLLAAGDHLRCEVEDEGVGIAPEDRHKLFQRFSQLEPGLRQGGTGLGLSIAKAIVESHGGAIDVESRPGHGSIFWFTLPLELGRLEV